MNIIMNKILLFILINLFSIKIISSIHKQSNFTFELPNDYHNTILMKQFHHEYSKEIDRIKENYGKNFYIYGATLSNKLYEHNSPTFGDKINLNLFTWHVPVYFKSTIIKSNISQLINATQYDE